MKIVKTSDKVLKNIETQLKHSGKIILKEYKPLKTVLIIDLYIKRN